MPAPQEVRAALIVLIADDLERSIASLGYPVGCGVAPHPDLCHRAAEQIVERISNRALELLSERERAA